MSEDKITREFVGGPKDGQTHTTLTRVRFVEFPNFTGGYSVGRYAVQPDGHLHWQGWTEDLVEWDED